LRAADRAIAHRLTMESLEHLLPWMPWAAGYDITAGAEFVAQVEADWAGGRSYTYLILDGPDPAGVCALHRSIGPGGLDRLLAASRAHRPWPGHTGDRRARRPRVLAKRRRPRPGLARRGQHG
jgi:hypothetical protein